VEALSQLSRIGQELLKGAAERDPLWKVVSIAQDVQVERGQKTPAPWERVKGGGDVLNHLGYTEYDGFSVRYPRASSPSLFADCLGEAAAELVLASAEISTLVVRAPPVLQTLKLLQEQCEPFPGHDAEGEAADESELSLHIQSQFITRRR